MVLVSVDVREKGKEREKRKGNGIHLITRTGEEEEKRMGREVEADMVG